MGLWIIFYVSGALAMMRYIILSIQNEIDEGFAAFQKAKKKDKENEFAWRLEWDERDVWKVFFTVAFWPFVALYYLVKFLMFPRGIKSRLVREKEKAAKAKKAERRAREKEARFRLLEDEVLRFGTAPLVDTEKEDQ